MGGQSGEHSFMRHHIIAACLVVTPLVMGCDKKSDSGAAPTSSALGAAERPSESAIAFTVQPGGKATFLMHAPLEKIHGEAPDSTAGELFVDPKDVSKSSALVKVDLDKLVLYQEKRENEQGEYGERAKSDTQNEHARAWLEIGEDAPKDVREKNRWVEFKIARLEDASEKDLTKLTGPERKITATAVGELRLHERVAPKRAKIEATFKFEGDKLVSVSAKTVEPVVVDLATHDVRPREAFGKLAQRTLEAMGSKVNKESPVHLEFTAVAK